jgi:hypothetical protein
MGAVMNEARDGEIRQWLKHVLKEQQDEARSQLQDRDRNSPNAQTRARAHGPAHKARGRALSSAAEPGWAQGRRAVPSRLSIGGLLFWFPKVFALLTILPCCYLLLLLGQHQDAEQWRGVVTALIWSFFALGFTLRHGLSRREHQRGQLSGLNDGIAHFGRLLMWLAVLIVLAWTGNWMVEMWGAPPGEIRPPEGPHLSLPWPFN